MDGQPQGLVALPSRDLATIDALVEQARYYAGAAKARATLRAYRSDWRLFEAWCAHRDLLALPASAEVIALYLADQASELKASTLQRRLSAISQAHQAAGHDSPTRSLKVRAVWAGIRRTHGTAEEGRAAILTEDLRAMVDRLPGIRDRALLLLGFAGAFRRSELVSLDVSDLRFTRAGLVVTLRRSKTDQEGQGTLKGIPHGANPETCPLKAVRAWLKGAGIEEGPLFRSVNRHGRVASARLSDRAVALAVKRAALAVGLDPDRYSGHSLRSGLATAAAAAGVSERAIMQQTGHRSVAMVRRYIRDGSLFRENAAGQIGL